MQEDGDNLAKARDIDFTVVFPEESVAQDFARGFRLKGL
jgi:hypothetical protein